MRTLRDFFPDVTRAELADILERFHNDWLRRGAILRHQLSWQGVGSVWAIDLIQAPRRIDGRYPYILSIRDLGSGEPILWDPVEGQTAEVAIACVLRGLDLRTALLVIKTDQGPAFRSDDFHTFLQSRGIVVLHSTPRTPLYNGACEAGIRHLKLHSRLAVALEGGDLERALARTQDFHEARNGGVPGSIVDPDLRDRFALRVAEETDIARGDLGLPSDRPAGNMWGNLAGASSQLAALRLLRQGPTRACGSLESRRAQSMMTEVRRALSVALLTSPLALVVCGSGCGAEEEKLPELVRPVRAMQVASSDAIDDRWFPGRAKATRQANVAFEVAGRMVQRPVNVGDRVEEGQLLARLDSRDFLNELEQAKAKEKQARAYRDRIAEAARTGAVSQQDLTDAEATLAVAESEVRIRAKALDDCELHAPFEGTISAILVENFENVLAKQIIMRLLDTTKIEMVVNIPESLISNVDYVTDVYVRFDAIKDAAGKKRLFPARILEVSNEATEATRTYPVNLIMDQPEDAKILPGMSGEASGRVELPGAGADEFEVSISALVRREDGGSFVWVIDTEANTTSRRDVQVGSLTSRGILVRGVKSGEWVAIAGVNTLQEGQKVRVLAGGRRG